MSVFRKLSAGALVVATAALGAWSSGAAASDQGMAAANQVSLASYQDFLDNWLFTHNGDNRGFGPEHDLARDNIEDFFVSYGLTVTLEPFQYSSNTYYNVVATKLGTSFPDQEYIVGAHFDSVDNPGADDNASGVALVLEAARILSQYDSAYTIRFIAFDREEQGLIGSYAYVADHAGDDILGMISTDMVAYNTGANSGDIHGGGGSSGIMNALAAAVSEYGDGLNYALAGPSGGSDHAPFENAGYEACLFIEDWGNPYYHSQQDSVDTPNYIDYQLATNFTRSIVGLFVDLAEVNVPFDGLSFTLPNGLPDYVDPAGGSTVRIEVTGAGSEIPEPGSGLLHYDIGSGWESAPMVEVTPNVYDAVFPAAECATDVLFYFSADSMSGQTYTQPFNAPGDHYSALAVVGQIVYLYDNFETNTGWTEENLGATSGDWQRGVPVNDPGWDYDPISDSDGSGQCYVTQNEMGNTDVDDGAVRLTSPVFDMTVGDRISYDYYLYLTNTNGIDKLLVEANNAGGAGAWATVATHTNSGGTSWMNHEISTDELIAAGVPPTATMQLRFTANDSDPQSIVEAGIDAFAIVAWDCGTTCPADLNGDNLVNVLDLLDLLAAWGACPGCVEDINGDGVVDVLDLLDLLAAWGPCP